MLASAAHGQVSFGFPGPGQPISTTDLPARVVGEVAITFQADAASGCAALAACGYRGRVVWRPGPDGEVGVLRYAQGRRVRTIAELLLGEGATGPNSLTAANVQRLGGGSLAGACGDEQSGLTDIAAVTHGTQLTFSLTDDLAPTRCAGPLAGDLASAAPQVSISTRALRRGNTSLDFRTQRPFAGHGFAGTITSTVVVELGRPHVQPASPPFPANLPQRRIRVVSERVTVTRAAGSLTGSVSGTGNADVCVLLDACGLAGTLTIAPNPGAADGALTATGPAARPYVDFLAALGLSSAGHAGGIQVFGDVGWNDRGTVSSVLHQGTTCTDTTPAGAGAAVLGVGPKTLSVAYVTGSSGGPAGGTALRTRCPGPIVGPGTQLASGAVPRRDLRRRHFTVNLAPAGSLDDQGYGMTFSGRLALTFRLGRVTQQVESVPTG